MSIYSMAQDVATATSDSGIERLGAFESGGSVGQYLHSVTGYVPAETLAPYLAVLAAFPPDPTSNASTRQGVFWVFLVLTALSILGGSQVVKANSGGRRLTNRWWKGVVAVWTMVAGTVSFAAWATTLPNSGVHPSDLGSLPSGTVTLIMWATVLVVVGALLRKFAK